MTVLRSSPRLNGWLAGAACVALLLIAGGIVCPQQQGRSLGCGQGGTFSVDYPKASMSATVNPTDDPLIYMGEIREDTFRIRYLGPMLAFADAPCDPSRTWGTVAGISPETVRFENGLHLLARQPIDQLRYQGEGELPVLREPDPTPPGIASGHTWLGSPGGQEMYVELLATEIGMYASYQKDFRLRYGEDVPDKMISPTKEGEALLVLPNALSPAPVPKAGKAQPVAFHWPVLFLLDSGHVAAPMVSIVQQCHRGDEISVMYLRLDTTRICGRMGIPTDVRH